MKENVDYEIIPSYEDEQAWNVRILKGPYTETVIKYGTVAFNKIKGNVGAKYMVKRLQKSTNFIKVSSDKVFKDFDKASDFRA